MHYYQHNIKDYKADAGFLSLLEDAVYRRLLDIYYLDEKELVLDINILAQKIGAKNDEEKIILENILKLFFTKTKKGYKHTRCDEEIKQYHSKSEKARASVQKRYTNVVRSKYERSTNVLLTKNKEPRTNNDGGLPPISPPYPSQSSGSVANADKIGITKARNAITQAKMKQKPLGILVLILAFLLLGQPIQAKTPDKIVVRYTISTPSTSHNLRPKVKLVARGDGGRMESWRPSSTPIPTPTPSPRLEQRGEGVGTKEEVARIVRSVYKEEPDKAVAVFTAESGLNPLAKGWNCYYYREDGSRYSAACEIEDRENAWSVDCGVAQMNVAGKECPAEYMDAKWNIEKSYIWKYLPSGWRPWVAESTGKWLQFMPKI